MLHPSRTAGPGSMLQASKLITSNPLALRKAVEAGLLQVHPRLPRRSFRQGHHDPRHQHLLLKHQLCSVAARRKRPGRQVHRLNSHSPRNAILAISQLESQARIEELLEKIQTKTISTLEQQKEDLKKKYYGDLKKVYEKKNQVTNTYQRLYSLKEVVQKLNQLNEN